MFKVSRVRLDGSTNTLDHLGFAELDQWMCENYGRFATVRIEHEQTGQTLEYTDNGEWWSKL